jgi:hypothetical protein
MHDNMPYETAKKLKDAGYPQIYPMVCVHGNYEGDLDGYCGCMQDDAVTYPTLSELIEACGVPFELMRTDNNTKWYTSNDNGKVGTGKTPEEAVTHLWLALNKK